jgi:hypothetical protein
MEYEEQILKEVLDNAEILELGDGSRWRVNPADMPRMCTWTPSTTIRITLVNPNVFYSHQLLNTENGFFVRAGKIK